ncbi:MAG: FAD-binding protein [Atribacterota bacterium]|nr:FAD-binding protein [Atribacterota bacterium]
MDKQKCDIVIVGGGGAGLKAAIEARKLGVDVILIQKGKQGESGSTSYDVAPFAGYSAADGADDSEDNPNVHYNDIMKASKGTADRKLVRILVEESVNSLKELRNIGIEFTKDESGKEIITKGCFASKPRNRRIKGHGHPISKKLSEQARCLGVKFFEDTMAIEIVISKRECVGIIALLSSGEKVFFNSISTILATGGAGQLFEWNLNPPDVTGDGYAMGYRAGAVLSNLEFMQAGFGTVEPFYSLINSLLWSTFPRLYNIYGEDILQKYLPSDVSLESCMRDKARHFPFSSVDNSKYLEIAAITEFKKTNCYLLLDISKTSKKGIFDDPWEEKMWEVIYDYYKEKGIDLFKEPLKINVFGHAMNGGLVIDENSETTIPSLFAVGECSAGPYGADRLGGNMLPFCQVFGKIAGQAAAHKSKKNREIISPTPKEIDNALSILNQLETLNQNSDIENLYKDLRKVSGSLLIKRNERSLLRLINELFLIRKKLFSRSYKGNRLIQAMELNNLLDSAKILATSAIHRRESRGSHYRDDYPNINEKYNCRIHIYKDENGEVHIRHSKLD